MLYKEGQEWRKTTQKGGNKNKAKYQKERKFISIQPTETLLGPRRQARQAEALAAAKERRLKHRPPRHFACIWGKDTGGRKAER